MKKKIWYFAQGDKPAGPLTSHDIVLKLASGDLPGQTLVWREGMEQWAAADTLPEFLPLFSATPAEPSGEDDPADATPASPTEFAARRAAVVAHHPDSVEDQPADYYDPHAGGHGAPRRTFGEAVAVCLWKFVNFKGRASRSEYWYFLLFVLLAEMATSILDVRAQSDGVITYVTTLVLLVPQLSVTWRRLHDTDHSGWWAGIMFMAPIVATIGMMTMVATGISPPAWATGHSGTLIFDAAIVVAAIYALTVFVFTLQPGVDRRTRFG